MYSLCYDLRGSEKSSSFVQVFDLGVLGDEFKKVTTITQKQIVESLHRDINGQTSFTYDDRHAESEGYRFKSIHPLVCSESHFEHLMIVTENGLRIAINFSETEDGLGIPDNKKEKLGQQFDYTYPPRFTSHWMITSVHATPSLSDAELVFSTNPSFFKITNLTRRNPANFQLTDSSYSNSDSCLVYFSNQKTSNHLTLCFLFSNQSLLSNLRDLTSDFAMLPSPSEFSLKESVGLLKVEEA